MNKKGGDDLDSEKPSEDDLDHFDSLSEEERQRIANDAYRAAYSYRPLYAIQGIEEEKPPEPMAYFRAVRTRRQIGYGIGLVALIAVPLLVFFETSAIGDAILYSSPPADHSALVYKLVLMGIQGAVTIALLVFFYRVLRASERLILPPWVAKDPETTRALLGEKTDSLGVEPALKLLASLPNAAIKQVTPGKE